MIQVTPEFVLSQIRRLSGLDFYPSDDIAVEELVKVGLCATGEQVLWRSIDSIVSESRRCPTPVDLRRVIQAENDRDKTWENPIHEPGPLCGKCQSNGYFARDGAFERCDCDNGRELPAKILEILNEPKLSPAPEALVRRAARMGQILENM